MKEIFEEKKSIQISYRSFQSMLNFVLPHLPYTQHIEHWAIECPCTQINMIYTCLWNASGSCVF